MTRMRRWSRQRVREAILDWHRQGSVLTRVHREAPNLYALAKRYFGSWNGALQAAGFQPTRKQWNKQAVIKGIRARHQRGLPLRNMSRHDTQLYAAGCRYFGGWHQALRAAGLPGRPPSAWTRERVIAAIRKWHQRGTPTTKIWKKEPLMVAAAYRCFDSWRDALSAAGLTSVRQRWSRERVLNELRVRYPQSCPRSRLWCEDGRLASAATRYFGTWHDALVAAGLRKGKRKPKRRWTRQGVIEAIRAYHQQGVPPTAIWKTDTSLGSAAKRLFGSWRGTVLAAGLDPGFPRKWTREEVVEAIRERQAQGLPLAGVWKDSQPLYYAAKKQFGTWQRALLAAGLPSKPRRRWTAAKVIAAIQARRQQGLVLSHVWKEDRGLFSAARRRFGNWQNALVAAGQESKPRRSWSKERVVAELAAWHRVSVSNIRTVDPSLAGAARRFFGSLDAAWEAAGLEPKNGRWNKRRVVAAIQDRYVRGLPIQFAGFREKPLAGAAKRHFGSWRAAVAAAGLAAKLPRPQPVRTWSKQKVLDAIRERHRQGLPLTAVWKEDTGFYSQAKNYFGTWRNAVRAAGLEPPRKQWSKRQVIREIRAWHEQGAVTSSISSQDPRLTVAGIRLFGCWHNALLAAGLDAKPNGRKQRSAKSTHGSRQSADRSTSSRAKTTVTTTGGKAACHART